MRVCVYSSLSASARSVVEIPVKSWAEIDEWYVKWDVFHYTLDGEKWYEIPLNSDVGEGIQWKHPDIVTIRDPDNFDCIDAS